MRVVAFAYDFPHAKSVEGLKLLASGQSVDDVIVWAAPFTDLGGTPRPPEQGAHPRDVAHELGFGYVVAPHASQEGLARTRLFRADVGIVLGARVLPENVLSDLDKPVVNVHPGLLPMNRGLGSVRWAIRNQLPQGVTAHLVTARIDAGPALQMTLVGAIGDQSTLITIEDEIRRLEMGVLVGVVDELPAALEMDPAPPVILGKYHSRPSAADLQATESMLSDYLRSYGAHVAMWRDDWARLRHHLGMRLRTAEIPSSHP
jgi:methionyl-tRNA formyltransferase